MMYMFIKSCNYGSSIMIACSLFAAVLSSRRSRHLSILLNENYWFIQCTVTA